MALIDAHSKEERKKEREKERQKLKKMMQNMDVVKYTVRIPCNIQVEFKQKLIREGKNMRQFYLDMIMKYLEKDK